MLRMHESNGDLFDINEHLGSEATLAAKSEAQVAVREAKAAAAEAEAVDAKAATAAIVGHLDRSLQGLPHTFFCSVPSPK